ncbi:MAG: ABC transporter permease [Treponema sp.]|nr:ABC transporter permease [Treponema sp.]
MVKYILQRLLGFLITMFIITTVCFIALRFMPGNVFDDPLMPLAVRQMLEARYHLDRPIPIQYLYFLEGIILRQDFGVSLKFDIGTPVFQVVGRRMGVTMQLNFMSMFLSLPFGIGLGILAALKRNRIADHVISVMIVLGISIPSFIFALLLQYFIAFRLGIFPILFEPLATGWQKIHSMILPVIALALGPIAVIARNLRAELIDTLNSEFMLLARTKGLNKFQATVRHAFRNSTIPVLGIFVWQFIGIFFGALVIEQIFSISGVGRIFIASVNTNDHPLTIALIILFTSISLLTVLLIDLLYGVVDPRIRIGGKKQ